MGLFSKDKERQEVATHMGVRGFGVLVQPDSSLRPERMTWYGAMVNGRLVVTTITRRRVATGDFGINNRHQNVVVLTIMMAAQVATPFGFGVHTHYGSLAEPTLERVFPPDHPAYGLPLGVKQAFLSFARGLIPPGGPDHRRYARHTRIVDTQRLAAFLPPGVLTGTSVVTMHDLPLDAGWQSGFDDAVNGLGWIAYAIEEAALDQERPKPTGQ